MVAMNVEKMLTEIVSPIRLLTTNWTLEALLLVVLGSDMTGEISSGCRACVQLGTVLKRATFDS
jgi:hypothetical protein